MTNDKLEKFDTRALLHTLETFEVNRIGQPDFVNAVIIELVNRTSWEELVRYESALDDADYGPERPLLKHVQAILDAYGDSQAGWVL